MGDSHPISVYGGFGFVLGEFCKQNKGNVIRIEKHEVEPQSPNILYGISTTDNYNIFDSPTLDIETNLIHFMEVLDSCREKYGNKVSFTLISTWFVYGQSGLVTMTEESYCNPTGFYSITARTREQLLISYCTAFGIPYKILRLANVLGAKDTKVSKKKNALQYLIQRIVMDEPIELYDNGEFYRHYIDVRDCAVAIKYAMASDLPYNIYNISNDKSYKFRDLINMAIDYSGSKSTIWDKLDIPEFHRIVQTKSISLSNSRLLETGYTPRYAIEDTIRDIIDDYKR